ncbi:17902_t:CDS:2 [Rhizophagus irregularis]|nr:17902_t:CDS:2 [Rhizophagus irregularis]
MHMNGNVVAQMLHENVLRRIDTGVRWSELLQLAYFNPVRFIVIDPIHCLFLSIARWIVKRIWIPSDLRQIPGKIYCREEFSNFTAD